ncbi:hypothetical protein [Fibrella aquatilis]|uniref:O-antigen ligase domain-containing protein n=1 Tax=Fibrella aquatilis TaxID=2817059 RepID=A0A939GBD1_9BACT|nr:hypothetical protein [Fibrella aquatilis]MBO0933561.1 hypothetical protein [Fibrella aquatilis]
MENITPIQLVPSIRKIILFCLVAILLMSGATTQRIMLNILLVATLFGPLWLSPVSLTISLMQFMLSPGLVLVQDPIISGIRIFLLIIVFIRTLIYASRYKYINVNGKILAFCVVIIFLSILSSYNSYISIFKIIQFFCASFAVLNIFLIIRQKQAYWINWYYNFIIFLSLASLPTLFIPEIGYYRNNIGFQGITNQPQALALFLSPAIALLLGQILQKKISLSQLFFTLLVLVELFYTKGRIGIISLSSSFIILLFISHRHSKNIFVDLIKKPVGYILLTIALFIAAYNQESVQQYIFKSSETSNTSINQAFFHSRGALLIKQKQNIDEHTLSGIGFGLPSWPEDLQINYDPVFNLPLSVPVEKGVFFVSIFEEIGIIGSFFFLLLLVALIKFCTSQSTPDVTWMVVTAIATNIGEATLFSFGGMGLYIWLVIGLGLAPNAPNPTTQ